MLAMTVLLQLTMYGIHYINMLDKIRKTYERNGIETMVDNNGVLWLNEKLIEEGSDHKHLQEITIKYHSDHKKHRYELVEETKNNTIEFS